MRNPRLRSMMLAALLAALTAVVSPLHFSLPGVPVPITLQTMAVLLAGALVGATGGFVAIALYVVLGAIGLPIYAGGAAGLSALFGPTGGYLFAFPVAAWVVGLLAPPYRAQRWWRTSLAMLAGLLIVYIGGGGWAILLAHKAFGVVLAGWVLPFIPLDLVKLALAAALSIAVNRALAAGSFGWQEGT